MEELKDAGVEQSTEELMAEFDAQEDAQEAEESQEESSTPETSQPDTSAEDVKTDEAGDESNEPSEDELLSQEQAIPYGRFKQFVDKRNEKYKTNDDDLENTKAELENVQSLLSNPETLNHVLEKNGWSEDKIQNYFDEHNISYTKPEIVVPQDEVHADIVKKYDLSTQEGWLKANEELARKATQDALKPIEAKLTAREREDNQKRNDEQVTKWENESKKMAEDIYKIPYGDPKKFGNPANTAVGKIEGYLKAHPEDAHLGHVKLLKLAMSEESFKQGEITGEKKAKEQNTIKKTAAMETEGAPSAEEEPNADWSTDRLLEYADKHNI